MNPKTDNNGAQIMAFHEVRSALVTANATITTGSPATLIAGDASYFLDITEITFSCGSTAALGTATVGFDLINDGTIVRHFDLVEGGTTQLNFDAPLKQVTKNTPWIIDMDDVTGTTVSVGATLVRKTP